MALLILAGFWFLLVVWHGIRLIRLRFIKKNTHKIIFSIVMVFLASGAYQLTMYHANKEHLNGKIQQVIEVTGPNQIKTEGIWIIDPIFRLAGTKVKTGEEENALAKQKLKSLIEGKKVLFVFPQGSEGSIFFKNALDVFIKSNGAWVNAQMVAQGLLEKTGRLVPRDRTESTSQMPQSSASTAQEQPSPTTEKGNSMPSVASDSVAPKQGQLGEANEANDHKKQEKAPWWVVVLRYGFYVLIGFTGAVSLGMVLNRRWRGFLGLALIDGFAIFALVGAIRENGDWLPPALTLAITLLLGGAGKRANLQAIKDYNLPK